MRVREPRRRFVRELLVGVATVGVAATVFAVARVGSAREPRARPLVTRGAPSAGSPSPSQKEAPMSLYDLSVHRLDGRPQSLSAYRGEVALVVNTASECGYTPQYEGLEQIYESYKDKGFVVLGFPSNDFGQQEPGTPEQIATFCSTRFHVTFPLFEKVRTKGEGQSPVFRLLGETAGEPKWNFHKYLVGRDGRLIRAFPSKVEPSSPELKAAIETALASPAPK
jgi:glutathione peroxidase